MNDNIGFEVYESNQQTVTLRRIARQKSQKRNRNYIELSEPMLEIHCMSAEEYDKLRAVDQRLRTEIGMKKYQTIYKRLLEALKNIGR